MKRAPQPSARRLIPSPTPAVRDAADSQLTDRRQAEHWAAEFFDAFAAPVAIYEPVRDLAGDMVDFRRVYANARNAELLRRPLSEVIGTTLRETGLPQFFDRNLAIFGRVLATGIPEPMPDVELTDPMSGLPLTLAVNVSRVGDRVAQMSRDVTLERTAAREIAAAHIEAQRANLAKSEFLSRMSHELRTPLNAVLGFAQLLEMDALTDEQREHVGYIRKGGGHLLELINEVLDISRIESGQMTISSEPVAVADVLDEALSLLRPLAEGQGIVLRGPDGPCSCHVLADRQRLKQIVLNLLSNAIKYNRPDGSVDVTCERVPTERLRINVTDSGYGIAANRMDRLFRPFDRLGAEATAVEGTGMGLALSRGLAGAMGGSISVASTIDVGTTFSLDLALAEPPLAQLERLPAPPGDDLAGGPAQTTILQIEDNLANLRLVERVLARRPGIRLLTAMQGQIGLDLARQHRPDMVLLDLHLPDMNGQEVLAQLHSHPETRDIPVVILSADATQSQASRLLEAGAAGYLTKPLDVGEFLRAVDRAVGPAPARVP